MKTPTEARRKRPVKESAPMPDDAPSVAPAAAPAADPTTTAAAGPAAAPAGDPTTTAATGPDAAPAAAPAADPTTTAAAGPAAAPAAALAADPITTAAADPATTPAADPTTTAATGPDATPAAAPAAALAAAPTTTATAGPATTPAADPITTAAADPATTPAADPATTTTTTTTAAPTATANTGPRRVRVDLALQGGGSHGAFTWGVLDRLLEEERLEFEGVSGTSAGAMNAAVLASGFAKGGREAAREALAVFWKRVSDAAAFSPFQRSPLDKALGRWSLDHSPVFVGLDLLSRVFSPYELAPWAPNPLDRLLAECVDFAAVAEGPVKVFVTATNVRTGRGRVFRKHELGVPALLASACLPTLFQAVEIDGDAYWDGGYCGNPTLTPLVRECSASDTIIVPINPIERPGTPTSARDIMNRLNEVSFNSSLMKELRMIALLRQVVDRTPPIEGTEGAEWARMRMHFVPNRIMADLGYSSKLNAEWEFLTMLRDEGRKAASQFLAEHGDDLGVRSTLPFDVLGAEA